MTKLADFTLEELMIFSVSIMGALGGLLSILFKSKCKTIDCCCLKCERDVRAVIEEEKLELGKNPTPRRSERIKNKSEENKNLQLSIDDIGEKEPENSNTELSQK